MILKNKELSVVARWGDLKIKLSEWLAQLDNIRKYYLLKAA
jgi:hypothetical protein